MESNSATPSGRGLCQRKAIFDHSEGQVDGFQVEPVWDDGGPCSSAARRFPQMSWPPGDGLIPRPSHRRSSACPASLSAHDGLIRVKTIISIVRGRAIRMKTIISMVHGTPCIATTPIRSYRGQPEFQRLWRIRNLQRPPNRSRTLVSLRHAVRHPGTCFFRLFCT